MRKTGGENAGDNGRWIPSALHDLLEAVSKDSSDFINQTLVKDLVVSSHNENKEQEAQLLKILYSKVRSSILFLRTWIIDAWKHNSLETCPGFDFFPQEIAKHIYQLKNGKKQTLNILQFSFNILPVYSLLPELWLPF